jgi:hypothetical protein
MNGEQIKKAKTKKNPVTSEWINDISKTGLEPNANQCVHYEDNVIRTIPNKGTLMLVYLDLGGYSTVYVQLLV